MQTNELLRKATFTDPHEQFRPRLIEAIRRDVDLMRADRETYLVTDDKLAAQGGWKVRGADVWDSEEAKALQDMVCQFVSQLTSQPVVHINDRWANVMQAEAGWYASPHSHSTADVAVVYALTDDDMPDSPQGKLQFVDPRIPACCRREGHVSAGLTPKMNAGDAIAFPGYITHWVSPYFGAEDRITLAFNVSIGPPPEGEQRNLESPVDLGVAKYQL